MKTHVIYTSNVVAPGNKITEDNEIFFQLDEIEEAQNTESAPYAHYYERTETDYDLAEYRYIETTNA